jgi:hypothetical protein
MRARLPDDPIAEWLTLENSKQFGRLHRGKLVHATIVVTIQPRVCRRLHQERREPRTVPSAHRDPAGAFSPQPDYVAFVAVGRYSHDVKNLLIVEGEAQRLLPVSMTDLGWRERDDLQRWVRTDSDVIEPGLLLISEELADWEGAGARVLDRLDLPLRCVLRSAQHY